jgi:hypothetical protein
MSKREESEMKRIRPNTRLIAILGVAVIICLSAVYFLFVAEGNPVQSRALSSPTLVSPINNAVVQSTPELAWSQVKSASTYELEIVRETPIKIVCSKRGLPATSASYRLQANEALVPGVYHWRVRAVTGINKAGSWSEAGVFRVQ